MGRNIKGGSKHKKYARNRDVKKKTDIKNLIKDTQQEYAFVNDLLGDCRLRVTCWDKKQRLAIIRGKLKKRCWINKSDLILISLREYEDDKCDVIQKYDSEQVKALVKKGEFTNSFAKNGNIVTFDAESSSDDEDDYENVQTNESSGVKNTITTEDLDFDFDAI